MQIPTKVLDYTDMTKDKDLGMRWQEVLELLGMLVVATLASIGIAILIDMFLVWLYDYDASGVRVLLYRNGQ